MDATELLEQQHRKVEGLFGKLEDMQREEAGELLDELANDLAAHMAIEQQLFYPAVREVDEELVVESFEEHSIAEVALKRLLIAKQQLTFKARVTALKELIQHHVEEEEHELFPKVQKALNSERLDQLGEQMEQLFEQKVKAGYKRLVPKGLVPTSADEAQKRKSRSKPAKRKSAPSRTTSRRRSAA